MSKELEDLAAMGHLRQSMWESLESLVPDNDALLRTLQYRLHATPEDFLRLLPKDVVAECVGVVCMEIFHRRMQVEIEKRE